MRNKRIEYIIDEILDQYAYADESTRPWIIGFSGGKDSTVLLMLVWIALEKLKEGNYILIYTNYVKTLHYICILCKKLLY